MSERANLRTGGQILVDALKLHGVDTAFCVPGESYLAALDALYDARDAIRLVVCRQEGGAAYMAEAYGKLTGRPGICLVTRGPGASNASVGVHTAFQDSTPMLLLVGQVARGHAEREAFQEVDFRRMYGPLAKWVGQIDDPARIPELVSRAFHTAVAGRPGPVVLALPEDMLRERSDAPEVGPYKVVQAHPGAADMARLRDMLAAAERPFMIVGGGGWDAQACADVAVGIYAGDIGIGVNPKLAERIKESDLLLVVGARLGEITTSGYTLVEAPRPRQRLVHVHAGAEELGRVYQADLPINAGPRPFAVAARALRAVDTRPWAEWTRAVRDDYLANLEPTACPGPVDLGAVVEHLREALPEDAIIANGAGNFTGWLNRFYPYRRYRTQLGSTSGSMGYGVPAGVAAKIVHPERVVVSWNGDGCFLMNGQELATAVQYRANVIFFVVNNGMYGTIRMHQERAYPGRVIGSELVNPDFAALACAYGAHGEAVERTEDFAAAFERAVGADRPALIELRVDPEALTTRASLSQIRDAAVHASEG
jgi:acetolactate synthase-1/2/3 large subunit